MLDLEWPRLAAFLSYPLNLRHRTCLADTQGVPPAVTRSTPYTLIGLAQAIVTFAILLFTLLTPPSHILVEELLLFLFFSRTG